MNKLEVIQKKLKALNLYRDYLLKLKLFYSLNGINSSINDSKYVKVKKL